jgi:hypothetical protein
MASHPLLLYYFPEPMERWAANTLRTLGIILTSGFVLIVSLLLALLSMCAAQGGFGGNRHPEQVVPYAGAAVLVAVIGILVVTWLARGIHRSSREAGLAMESASVSEVVPVTPRTSVAPPSAGPLPLRLSPLSRNAIHRLVFALGAQIVVSGAAWIFNQLHFWSGPRIFAPFPYQNALSALLIPFVLYHLPYAILIYVLLNRPDRRAFAYSLAVPAVLILQAPLSVGFASFFLANHPIGFLVLFIPWAIHIVILVLAYQAIQHVGLHPFPSSIIVAALATFLFFSLINVITPLLYRFLR